MNKSFFKGAFAGAIASVLAIGIVAAGCGSLAKGNSGVIPTVGVGYPPTEAVVPTIEATLAPTTVAPEKNPTEIPVVEPTKDVEENTSATATPEAQPTKVAEATATPTPTPTKVPTSTPTPTPDLRDKDLSHVLDESFLQKMQLLIDLINGDYYADLLYYKDVAVEDVQNRLFKALFESLDDPYSEYYTPEEYAKLMESTSGEYYGIGSYVSQDIKTNVITLTQPFKEGPAYAAGLRAGDILIKVNDMDVTDMNLDDVVKIMKGPAGTTVTLSVKRGNNENLLDFVVTRAKVEVPTVETEIKDDNIGYVAVSAFDRVTAAQYMSAVDDMLAKGVKGLIIDLRNNGGGVLDGCVAMADYMLPDGKMIVYTKTKNGIGEEEFKSNDGHQVDVPVVILVNQYSASASEVFTASLKDNGRATVIGVTSYGKGIVQSLLPLTDGSGMKITTSSYFTPADICIHGIGITPDIVVENEGEEDRQLEEALKWFKK